jgi:hypothetical protein
MGMAMIRADLARLPARHGNVPIGDLAENIFDVALRIPLLLALETKNVHGDDAPGKLDCSLSQSRLGQERAALRITGAH